MKKVLIIEDDPIVAHIYRTRLEKEGYEVEIASDGQSGFYRIHEVRPDAVMLDLMLPKMNGVDILRKIRAQKEFQQIPIIVFTNAYVPNMIHESLQAGATQVYNKASLTPRQILDALHNAIEFAAKAAGGESAGQAAGTPATSETTRRAQGTDFMAVVNETPFHAPNVRNTASFRAPVPTAAAVGAPASLTPPPPPSNPVHDAAMQADVMQNLFNSASETIAKLRKQLLEFSKTQDEEQRLNQLNELYRKVHALTGGAALAGLGVVSHVSSALEVLLKDLHEKPKNINPSTLRTVAHAIDFIGQLFERGPGNIHIADTPPVSILVVDDEILSRRAVTYALEKANLKAVGVEDPAVALQLATENTYDLIFLDVQMPGMDGFELCTKIRALPTNKNTPVIFVTSLTDFKNRAKSSLSGGSDLIAKPFMFIELTVKALTFVLRNRLNRATDQVAA